MSADPAVGALQGVVDALWARAGLGPADRLLGPAERQEAHSFVEPRGGLFRFAQWERGVDTPLTGWLPPEEAARRALSWMAADRAMGEELRVRGDGGYSRWNWMAPAIAAMRRISEDHGQGMARDYEEVLARAPLDAGERRAARFPLPDGPALR